MKTLKENATHEAILNTEKNRIEIWLKGIEFEDLLIKPEYLYSIPKENEDDLFAIFENLDETNRILAYEFRQEVTELRKSIYRNEIK
jgi:hypothetical protein